MLGRGSRLVARSSSASATARGSARFGVHRADDANVVDAGGRLGKISLTSRPLWPVHSELEGAAHRRAGLSLGSAGCRPAALAVQFVLNSGLGSNVVDVRRPTVHEQMDDALGPRGKVRRPWEPVDCRRSQPASAEPTRPSDATCRPATAVQSLGRCGRAIRGASGGDTVVGSLRHIVGSFERKSDGRQCRRTFGYC